MGFSLKVKVPASRVGRKRERQVTKPRVRGWRTLVSSGRPFSLANRFPLSLFFSLITVFFAQRKERMHIQSDSMESMLQVWWKSTKNLASTLSGKEKQPLTWNLCLLEKSQAREGQLDPWNSSNKIQSLVCLHPISAPA